MQFRMHRLGAERVVFGFKEEKRFNNPLVSNRYLVDSILELLL